MDKEYYPGGAICMTRNNAVLFEKTYGDFNPDTKVYETSAGKWVVTAIVNSNKQ